MCRILNIFLAIHQWLKSVPYYATCTAVLEKETIKYIKKLEILPINISHQICGPHLSTKKENVRDLITNENHFECNNITSPIDNILKHPPHSALCHQKF